MKKKNEMKTTLMKNIKGSINCNLEIQKIASFDLLELAVEDNDMYAIAFAHSYLADYYILTRDHASCIEHLHESLAISEEHQYLDLLLLDYTMSGLYHNSHFDEATAVQFYLDGLRIAQESENLYEEMIILNHISDLFYQKEDVAEALLYIKRAYDIFLKRNKAITEYAELIVILNLIQLNLLNNKREDAYEIYQEYIPAVKSYMTTTQATDVIHFCELMLAEANGEIDKIYKITDYFAHGSLEKELNRSIYFTLYHDIFDMLLRIKDKKRVEQFLQLMGEICLENDIEQQLQLHLSWINFAETFHMEDTLINSYKQYYLLQKMVGDITNKTKAESMKEKIVVNHMLEERDHIMQEKNFLAAKVKTDELTRLFNRSYFNTLAIAMHANKGVRDLGFILIDVDYFKEYNDFYGHYQGDILLKQIASCLDENCDSRFFAARYGGDEFICLCVNVTEEEMEDYLIRVYEQLQNLEIEHQQSACANKASISAGYALFKNEENFNYDVGVTLADAALYKAKQMGKNQYTKY